MAENLAPRNFCQKPSDNYLEVVDACGDDPRSAAGYEALAQLRSGKGGGNAWDAREAGGVGFTVADIPLIGIGIVATVTTDAA